MKGGNHLLLLIVIPFLFMSACETDDNYRCGCRYFMVSVDSVSVPDSIPAGEQLTIRYWGYIGPNGCYSFSHFEKSISADSLFIRVWAKYDTAALICHAAEMVLQGEPCTFKNLNRGRYDIITIQPDETYLQNQLIVL